jgi:hypothetical protein
MNEHVPFEFAKFRSSHNEQFLSWITLQISISYFGSSQFHTIEFREEGNHAYSL